MNGRTWDENRQLINGLWPRAEFSPEEADLMRSDLSGLDQAALFEAIRNVKRTRESIYPQLVWFLEEYRAVRAKTRAASRPLAGPPAFTGPRLAIDDHAERRLRSEIADRIERAKPSELEAVVETIRASIDRLSARSVVVLMAMIRERREGAAVPRLTGEPARLEPPVVIDVRPEESDADIEARRLAALRVFGAAR